MENEEKGILVEQVVQADRIRTHGKFHERLFLLLRIIYFLIGMLGVALARNKSCILRGISAFKSVGRMFEIAPVKSFFLAVPYPITTTSSSA